MKKLFLTSLVAVLSMLTLSCSSSNESTNYYLLTNKVSQLEYIAAPLLNSEKHKYQLSLKIPEYLQKPYLVMQLDENKIHYSMFHLWAEPLNKGLSKALLFDLNIEQSNHYFITAENDKPAEISEVLLTLDYFHITERASVILAGQFAVQNGDKKSYQRFSFEQKLTADGYSHAISQMRLLITKLSKQIAAGI